MRKNKTIGSFVDLNGVDYKELLLLDTKRASQEEIVDANSFPFFKKGSTNESILFIHDIGESPNALRIMAEYVGRLGYYTYNCRLPGHGSKIMYLSKFSFIDWYESLKCGYFALKNISKSIIVIGKGIGAYLGILLSMYNKVDRLNLLLPELYDSNTKIKNLIYKPLHFIKSSFINHNFHEKNELTTYRVFPKRTINESNKLINFLIKNIHLYNKLTPITIHPYQSKNMSYFYKTQDFLEKLYKSDIKIDKFNMNLLNKFKVIKDVK
jgi:esterase/lipase